MSKSCYAWRMLWRMSRDLEKLPEWNMPGASFRIRQFANASGIHEPACFTVSGNVDLYDKNWPIEQVEKLLADLYDMGYRSFASGLAEVLGILRGKDLVYTPKMMVEKYGG